jgi:ubiquinol-cytochrome c reductase cytochrome b subunit
MYVLAVGVVAYAILVIGSVRSSKVRIATAVVAAVLVAGFFAADAKVWGVVLMGGSVVIMALLPWLDQAPVKSIRYKGPLYKTALTLFVISFLVLGYLGTQTVTAGRTLTSQIFTAVYFMFFLLMPWYSRLDKCKPEPERITGK